MLTGSCLCGGIRYEYHGSIQEISMCHCAQCRKATGSAYIAVSPVHTSRFKIIKGAELLKAFQSSPNKARVFCSNCGSPIYSKRDDLPEVRRLRLGTVETPFECSNAYHIFVDSKAQWEDIMDGLPKYSGFKPEGV